MIVYVESNFFLEVALGQEQASPAEAILALAESGKIQLAFPSFAFSEPFATVAQRDRERRRLRMSFIEMLKQLQRSEPHKQITSDLQHVPLVLTNIVKKEFDLLQLTVSRVLSVGKSIEIGASEFMQALAYQKSFDLSPQDSIVYAAMIADLQQRPPAEIKCFVSRNWKDFDDSGIKFELATYKCRYISSFVQGLNFIQHAQ